MSWEFLRFCPIFWITRVISSFHRQKNKIPSVEEIFVGSKEGGGETPQVARFLFYSLFDFLYGTRVNPVAVLNGRYTVSLSRYSA